MPNVGVDKWPAKDVRWRRLAVPVLFVGLVLVGCSSSDGGDTSESTTTEATSTSGGSETTVTTTGSTAPTTPTTTPTGELSAQDFVGDWTADANQILGANTANIGGQGAAGCSGPIVMTLTSEGRFERSGDVVCGAAPIEATGTIRSTGEWFFEAPDTLVIADTSSTGSAELNGTTIPFPDAFGDGEATVSLDGDVLEITFTIDPVGTVTQKYVRA